MISVCKRWLVLLGLFIARLGGYTTSVVLAPSDEMAEDVLKLAITLTRRQETQWPDRDGECKRAQVYAELVNIYPRHDKRLISRAIEEALRCGA